MTESDVLGFTALAKRVGVALGRRTDFDDFKGLTSTYFRALRRYDLVDLERAADLWIGRETRFPKPAEWASAIPRQDLPCRVMSTNEAKDYLRADQLGFEDEPCGCLVCREAQVHEKPLRFVPDDADRGDLLVMNPITNKVVPAGHWAHGWELFRWYQARANHYDACLSLQLEAGRAAASLGRQKGMPPVVVTKDFIDAAKDDPILAAELSRRPPGEDG